MKIDDYFNKNLATNKTLIMYSTTVSTMSTRDSYDFECEDKYQKWKNILLTSLERIQKRDHSTLRVNSDALQYVENLILKLLSNLIHNQLNSVADAEERVKRLFPKPLDMWAISKAQETLTLLKTPKKQNNLNADQLPIRMPVERVHQLLQKEVLSHEIDIQITHYLVAILEFIATYIFRLAANYVGNNTHQEINYQDIKVAMCADKVLMDMFYPEEDVSLNVNEDSEQKWRTSVTYEELVSSMDSYICNNLQKKMSKMLNNSEDKDLKLSLERFGDDLTEVILSYLPINEKIRMECLSKQVQSLIFNKQKCLRINNYCSEETDYDLNELILKTNSFEKQINVQAFRSVLKKFMNLQSIIIEENCIRNNCHTDLIDIIADNCPKLKTLWINEKINSSMGTTHRFALKCGSSVESLKFNDKNNNLLRILLVSKYWPKLKEIDLEYIYENTLHVIQSQVFGYSRNLRKISVEMNLSYNDKFRILPLLGNFLRLQTLELTINYCNIDLIEEMETGFRQLAEKSLHLKHLSVSIPELEVNILSYRSYPRLFSLFSSFQSLISLKILVKISGLKSFRPRRTSYYGSISDLWHLSQLKRLILFLHELSDTHIENINKYLPQLISIEFWTYQPITDKSLQYLSQLKNLSKLFIRCRNIKERNITDIGIKQMINGCPKLRRLLLDTFFSADFEITESSIDAMITRSERIQKTQNKFWYIPIDKIKNELNQVLDILYCFDINERPIYRIKS